MNGNWLTPRLAETTICRFMGENSREVNSAFSARTAGDIWRGRTTRAGNSVAFRFREGDDWRSVAWQQADAAAREIAGGLAGLGVGVGECVCILAQTRLEWILCDVGLVLAGAVSVPIYPSSTPEQCAFIIKDSGARIVITEDATQLRKLVPLLAEIPKLRLVFFDGDAALGGADAQRPKDPRLQDVLSEVEKAGGAPPLSLAALRQAGQAWLTGHAAELDRRAAEVGPDRMRARGLDEAGLEAYYRSRNLLKAGVTAKHVANAVIFFVTRQTPTTGATIPIDGGLPEATPR